MTIVKARKDCCDGNDLYITVIIDAADISLYVYELMKSFNCEKGDVIVRFGVNREGSIESIRYVKENALQYTCDAQDETSSDQCDSTV